MFPPIVTGPTVTLIGVSLIQTGFQSWAGGSGSCINRPETGFYSMCPDTAAPHPLPWGSAEFLGLGFSVFATIILCERFGAVSFSSLGLTSLYTLLYPLRLRFSVRHSHIIFY